MVSSSATRIAGGHQSLCRHCEMPLTLPFCDLGVQPPSNANLTSDQLNLVEKFAPLRALVCSNCWLAQLDHCEDVESIFNDDYAYFSSYSASWLEHARHYAEEIIQCRELGPQSLVVEVGSNDGYLLRNFKDAGIRVLGIEPSKNVAESAIEKHDITTEIVFFGLQSATDIQSRYGSADLIAGNNVLAHVPNINDFVSGITSLLAQNGIATIEFPHLMELIRLNQFDTIYHEHFSYLSLTAVRKIFNAHGLTIYDVKKIADSWWISQDICRSY